MMQKRTIYSLLLISFILVFALSLSAQEVSVPSIDAIRCQGSSFDVTLDNSAGNDLSAVEIVFEITGSGGAFFDVLTFTWNTGLPGLSGRYVNIDIDAADHATVRLLAMKADASDACLAAGTDVIGTFNFTTNDACSGVITIGDGVFSCPTFDVSTQLVDCATNEFTQAAVVGGTITIVNQPPTLADIDPAIIHFGDTYHGDADGSDPDLLGGCEALTYSLVSDPVIDDMIIDEDTGNITWPTDGDDVGLHYVVVQVDDACGGSATTSFTICVENDAPVINDPENPMVSLGDEVVVDFTALPDDGPLPLTYTIDNFTGPGTPSLVGGIFTWQTFLAPEYAGEFTLSVIVTDGAPTDPDCSPNNSDTATVTIRVVNYLVAIEKTHGTLQGQEIDVHLTGAIPLFPSDTESEMAMGGFDFLIQYDNSALTFQYAVPDSFYYKAGWEYFTYRSGNCGTGCPTGEVRIVAIAETNNGDFHPDYFTTDEAGDNRLAILRFMVTNDRTFECMYAPIRFFWYDCGDNTISSKEGNNLFISKYIYNWEAETSSDPYEYQEDIADPYELFPSIFGADTSCNVSLEDGKPDPWRFITFINGGVDIICADDIDDRGDLNMNGIVYEVADAVLYSRYFVYGMSVFTPDIADGQIAASDVNADGLTLSVADLVYLIRVVIGDANPYPKEVAPVNASYVHASNGTIKVSNELSVGAAHVVMGGDVTPLLMANNMEMIYHFNGTNTNVLVYSLDGHAFSGEMISAQGEIVSIDMADFEGNPVVAKWIPENFGLNQNYPNPFNPTTTLSFQLPKACDYNLTVFNVQGQRVQTFEGHHEAGVVNIEWDASNMASGIYFYRLNAENFSDTRKMVLLK